MRRGFTLIELLVVIAIIAILAAILFPVFARAQDKAKQAACASNEKQLGLAILMYVQDYDESMPFCPINGDPSTSVPGQILPYVRNQKLFECESAKATQYDYFPWKVAYFWNGCLMQVGYQVGLGEIGRPSETVMMWETGSNGWRSYARPCNASGLPDGWGQFWHSTWGARIHTGGENMGFADGHVKWVKEENQVSGLWGLTPTDDSMVYRNGYMRDLQ